MDFMKIILLGLKGVGKTTVGSKLAKTLEWPFIDTDEEISKIVGRHYREFFLQDGEAKFRAIESNVLKGLESESHSVIAVGGGGFVCHENQKILSRLGTLICLHMNKVKLLERWGEWPLVCKSREEFDDYYQFRIQVLSMLSCVWIDAAGNDVEGLIRRVCNV